MAQLTWDNTAEHLYETGVSKGVLYVYDAKTKKYGKGVAWNGLISVSESPSGAEETALYADNKKYLSLMSVEEFGATINAYTYPNAFKPCVGEEDIVDGVSYGQQAHAKFAFCYQTKVGSAEDNNLGYKIHIVYGALAAASEKEYSTVNDSPEAMEMSWEITTTPVKVADGKYTSCITVDSTKFTTEDAKGKLATLESKLYGSNGTGEQNDGATEPTLVMPDELATIFASAASGEEQAAE